MEKRLKSFDGTEIYYNYNKGRIPLCLVFLHGVAGNWTVWKKEIEFFSKKGFTTLALDLRGHGGSEAPEEFEKYQMTNFSKDIRNIIHKEKIKNFILIGHSLGGGIAINYCVNFPKNLPSALILVETACLYPYERSQLLNVNPYLSHLLRFIASHKLTREKHFFHFKEVDLSDLKSRKNLNLILYLLHLTPLRTMVKALDNVENYVFNNKRKICDSLRNLKIPALVITGDQDEVVSPKFSFILKKLLQSAEFKVVKDSDHWVIMQKSDEVSRMMQNFLMKNFYEFFFI